MEMGGVYAEACIRGGGEYGRSGTTQPVKNKQNCFDDFIARPSGSSPTGIRGQQAGHPRASNGGLLVGACMTQRPDLFGATLPAVGVMDMLRFRSTPSAGRGPAITAGRTIRRCSRCSRRTARCTTSGGYALPATLITRRP